VIVNGQHFSVLKCDLFYSRDMRLSIKMLHEMKIKDVCFVNCDFALFILIYFIIAIIDIICIITHLIDLTHGSIAPSYFNSSDHLRPAGAGIEYFL
jgi:hypothetical protein